MSKNKVRVLPLWYVSQYGHFEPIKTRTGVCTTLVLIILFSLSATGGKHYSLEALAEFDVAKLPDAKIIGQDILRCIQELQLKHWGYKDVGHLPEDTIQQLILRANGILNVALTLEHEVINLKQQGLRLWNIAIGSHACGRMLQMLEDIFGFLESAESKLFDQNLVPESETPEELPPEVETGESPSSTETTGDMGPPAHAKMRPLKCSIPSSLLSTPPTTMGKIPKLTNPPKGKGKARSFPLESATPFLVGSEKEITMVGVTLNDICLGRSSVPKHPRASQSIYQCRICTYVTKQKTQVATHICMHHTNNCIQCHLCNY